MHARLKIAAAVLIAFGGHNATQAQGIPVIDVANLIQTILQVMNDIKEIQNQVQQINQLQQQIDSLNGMRQLGNVLNNPMLHNYVPPQAHAVINTVNRSGYDSLEGAAKTLRDASMVYNCLDREGEDRRSCQASLALPYQYQGLLQEAMETAAGRIEQIESLMHEINSTSDQKAIQELQARISAENALLSHEATQIQMLHGMAVNEERISKSRDRERQYEMVGRTGDVARYLNSR
jgi:type IV secretion system protein VirB5